MPKPLSPEMERATHEALDAYIAKMAAQRAEMMGGAMTPPASRFRDVPTARFPDVGTQPANPYLTPTSVEQDIADLVRMQREWDSRRGR